MKFAVTFKTPGILDGTPASSTEDEEKWEDYNAARTVVDKFIKYEEYITIEFDTETCTAKVVPLK